MLLDATSKIIVQKFGNKQSTICNICPILVSHKGSFTYYAITEGEGGFQMITFDYKGKGEFWLMMTQSKIIVIFANFL